MSLSRCAVAAAVLAAKAVAYVAPTQGPSALQKVQIVHPAAELPRATEQLPGVQNSAEAFGAAAAAAASFGVGALLGWLNSSRGKAAGAAAASVVALTSATASAEVDYGALEFLGGSDKVDINNANVQAYRQFPGMYPTAAGFIATHGPYKEVKDIYKEAGLDEKLAGIIKKYEKNLVCLPPNPAYYIDRINNAMYR